MGKSSINGPSIPWLCWITRGYYKRSQVRFTNLLDFPYYPSFMGLFGLISPESPGYHQSCGWFFTRWFKETTLQSTPLTHMTTCIAFLHVYFIHVYFYFYYIYTYTYLYIYLYDYICMYTCTHILYLSMYIYTHPRIYTPKFSWGRFAASELSCRHLGSRFRFFDDEHHGKNHQKIIKNQWFISKHHEQSNYIMYQWCIKRWIKTL